MKEKSYYLIGLTEVQKSTLMTALNKSIQDANRDLMLLPNNPYFPTEEEKQEKREGLEALQATLIDICDVLDTSEPQECMETEPDEHPRYGWFSIKEQLPCFEEHVLAQDSWGHHGVAWLMRNGNGSTTWWSCDDSLEKEYIVAWMPIADYKEELDTSGKL